VAAAVDEELARVVDPYPGIPQGMDAAGVDVGGG